MKRRFLGLFAALIMGVLIISACGSKSAPAEIDENPAPPAPYAGKTNPLAGQADAVAAGKTLYDASCASCHGTTGIGDGPAGTSLDPKPEDLTKMSPEDDTDAFFYWRIADGGALAPFNSAMPAWKGILTEDQIWQIVTYLRTIEK